MVQQVLSCCESIDSDLSIFLDSAQNTYSVYLGVSLLEKVGADPNELNCKMLIGRLYNAGAKVTHLQKTFNHDPRTIKKWGEALLSNDPDVVFNAFAGRTGHTKAVPYLIRYVIQQYGNRASLGKNYRQKIIDRAKEVFGISICNTLASNIFKVAKEEAKGSVPQSNIASESAETLACSEQEEHSLSSDSSATVQQSPCFPVMTYSLENADDVVIHHAGLVLFGYALENYDPFQSQIICQLLQGALNIERSKSLCFNSLRYFVENVEPVLRTQRKTLDKLATPENIIDLYKKNAQILPDGPGKGDVFYFDPHTKEYTGQLKVLKGWCGSAHSVSKVINLDSFHTRSGRPCYIRHYSPYYDMRERFFMSLSLFNQLFKEDQRSGRTFIIDRGIFGQDCFMRFTRDYLITWEKGYTGDGWDEGAKTVTFTRAKQKNSKSSKRAYSFECQEHQWSKNSSFRRIIVKATNYKGTVITVSILCSNPTMDITEAVWLICNRWLQENDFKYLAEYLGINQLDSNKHEDFARKAELLNDRKADSDEYKITKKNVATANSALAKKLLETHKTEKELKAFSQAQERCDEKDKKTLQSLRTKIKNRKKKLIKLSNQKAALGGELEAAELKQAESLRKESRIQQLINGSYKLLDTARKEYIDALRINASNIFRNLHAQYREIYDDYRDDHYYLRLLTRVSGFINATEKTLSVRLWAPGTLQPRTLKSFEHLAISVTDDINRTGSTFQKHISIEILSGPVSSIVL